MEKNKLLTGAIIASSIVSAWILAWGIITYPRFGDIRPSIKELPAVANLDTYAGVGMKALGGYSAAAVRRSGGIAPKGIVPGNASVNQEFSVSEVFKIIGTSDGDTGKVWFLKGKMTGVVIAAGEPGNAHYAFTILDTHEKLTDGESTYRIEGE
jgi:hypothetical protein